MDWLPGAFFVLVVFWAGYQGWACWRTYQRLARKEREFERLVDDVLGEDEDQPRGLA